MRARAGEARRRTKREEGRGPRQDRAAFLDWLNFCYHLTFEATYDMYSEWGFNTNSI